MSISCTKCKVNETSNQIPSAFQRAGQPGTPIKWWKVNVKPSYTANIDSK